MGLLSLAIWLPIVFGVFLLLFKREDQVGFVRWFALLAALIGFFVTVPLYAGFDNQSASMQFVEKLAWIERFNVFYHLGVDGISFWFVPLTAFITVIVVIASWKNITERVNQYMGAFLILSGLMIGVFSALDGLLFYVFFEATLIPMYLIIGIWGGPNKIYAAFKFFLFTLMGSLLFLVAMIYLFVQSSGSFSILEWHKLPIELGPQIWLFLGFMIAFAVKVPMWPVHTWLPDAHVEAPTAGSVLLAAIAVAVVKHNNPCGLAIGATAAEAHKKAHACDPMSAYGGVIACNSKVTLEMAESVRPIFTEVIVAPDYEPAALELLQTKKKNLRILKVAEPPKGHEAIRQIDGGLLVQDTDLINAVRDDPDAAGDR